MADRIEGLDNVLTLLQQLPREVSAKSGGPVLRALRKGGRLLATEVALNLARTLGSLDDDEAHSTGLLQQSIAVTRGKAPAGGNGERVLVRFKRKTYQRKGKPVTTLASAQLKEYGSKDQKAEPFIRPAFNAKAPQAIVLVSTSLVADVEKLARKYLK